MGSSPLTRGKRGGELHPVDLVRLIPAHAGKTTISKLLSTENRAHPRSRGENALLLSSVVWVGGSSPLTRGKPWCKPRLPRRLGLIPAHAGKTLLTKYPLPNLTAHPRSRGENGSAMSRLSTYTGSSPLTRGKQRLSLTRRVHDRLIPAHAGKTGIKLEATASVKAHPRSRGENLVFRGSLTSSVGSSPLTRGKLRSHAEADPAPGLIPAHAGKTFEPQAFERAVMAHPRSRGENLIGAVRTLVVTGSSPLTRGKRPRPVAGSPPQRLIPAHAGKTRPGGPLARHGPAHPRSRGENVAHRVHVLAAVGSSPLTRGKQEPVHPPTQGVRLIPAHAGKTSPGSAAPAATSAHPRSRGENLVLPRPARIEAGSSPLTRGKRRAR